ncbi:MAG: aldehyde dehydrogenase family protein [Sporichthyaceae bacterium]
MPNPESRALDVAVPHLNEFFIGGAWVAPATPATRGVVMPSTEEVIVTVPDPSPADADAAVAAARQAFDHGPWPRMTVSERVAVCRRFGAELERRMTDMNRAWSFESGYTKAHGDMINTGAGPFVWNNALDIAQGLPWEERRTSPATDVLVRREPIGTVLAILTYNGPVVLMGMKVIPGLIAGCTFVVKFAPDSQLTARQVCEAAEVAGFPSGVFNGLAADTEASRHLVSHPGIDMVHMTGGTPIAVDVVTRTAPRLARTALELGGKAPAIICQDADLDAVLPTLVFGSTGALGQVCISLQRILAPRARYEEIVERLAAQWSNLKVGDPFDPSNDFGPLANERALVRVEKMLARALEQGARVAAGGRRPPHLDRGFFFEPTLLRDVEESMDIARDEVFGPIVVAIPYDDDADAVRIANSTTDGLAASVYSADPDRALGIAKQLRTGTVAINMAGCSLTEPFGGVGTSGWGRECGAEGILEFTQIKQVLLRGSYAD